MSISKEQIRQDVLDYFSSKNSIIDIEEHIPVIIYNIDDYDLVDMEIELEEKHGVTHNGMTNSSDIDSDDSLIEIVNKLHMFLNK